TEGLKRLGVGDYSFRWRLAGAEYASDLNALTAAVGVLARRCGGARSGEVLKRLRGYSRAWKREDSFSEGEADELMRFLREQLEPMGALHNAMLALEDVIQSSAADPEMQNPKTRRTKGKPQAAVMEQMQVVHQLQRGSLWNHPLERPVLLLAVSLGVLWQQYRSVFGRPAPPKQEELKATLGAAGLPSLFARVLLGVEQMREMSPISQPFKEQRRELYSILPSTVRRRLAKRLKQRSKRQIDGAIARDLRGVVGDILRWVVPLAERTECSLPSSSLACFELNQVRWAVPLAERTEVWNGDKSFGMQKWNRGRRTLLVEVRCWWGQGCAGGDEWEAVRVDCLLLIRFKSGLFEAVLVELLASATPLVPHPFPPPPPFFSSPCPPYQTLHYCDKDKFEAVLVELLTSFSLVTLHFRRSHLQPHPPSKARPPSGPVRRKQPGSAEPKNQAAPSTAPPFPPSASAPTFASSNSMSNGYGNSEGNSNSNSNDNSSPTSTAYGKSMSVSATPAAAAASAASAAPPTAARPSPMARAISITDAPDGGVRQPRTGPYRSGPPSSPRAGPASRSAAPGPPSSPRPRPASGAAPPGPPSMARSASSAPPSMARTAHEPPPGPAMPRPAPQARPGPGPAPGPGGPRGNPTGPRPRPGAGPGPRPSPGQAMPGRGGMGPGAGVPPGMRAGPPGPQARPGPQYRTGGPAQRPMQGARPMGPGGGMGGGRGGGGRGGGGGPVYRPNPASPVLDDIDGMPIRRPGGNVSAGQRQKMQQREWLKREMQQGGSHAMG
ncbi:unnamed protein product, partial [Closterium sp. NIES-54]